MPERLFLFLNVRLRDKKCGFWGPEFAKFPVKFPVSREFGQRKVSARLPSPPASLNCRETPLVLGITSVAHSPHVASDVFERLVANLTKLPLPKASGMKQRMQNSYEKGLAICLGPES